MYKTPLSCDMTKKGGTTGLLATLTDSSSGAVWSGVGAGGGDAKVAAVRAGRGSKRAGPPDVGETL